MFLFYCLYFFFFPTAVYAYLDPGTGSLLLYAVAGLVTTLVFALRGVWYWIRSHLFVSKATASQALPDIVFHSEGGKYWHVFEPVIKELNSMGVPSAYVTPDKNDPVFEKTGNTEGKYENLTVVNPGKEVLTLSYMNNVRAKVVVSTTPQLDVMTWKRSKNVDHYTHLFHAPTDIGTYDLYAFDHYDSLLCVGEFQKKAVREIERRRKRPGKELFDTGCTYYDVMKREMDILKSRGREERGTTVLYAPTWGTRSSLIKYGEEIIDRLGASGYSVIFRPHPQLYISNGEEMRVVEARTAAYTNIRIDKNRTPVESMFESDILLTDLSGILFDYALLRGKPIILFEGQFNLESVEAVDMGGMSVWDERTAAKVAFRYNVEKLGELASVIEERLRSVDGREDAYGQIRDELYNFGHAAKTAAEQIVEIAKRPGRMSGGKI